MHIDDVLAELIEKNPYYESEILTIKDAGLVFVVKINAYNMLEFLLWCSGEFGPPNLNLKWEYVLSPFVLTGNDIDFVYVFLREEYDAIKLRLTW